MMKRAIFCILILSMLIPSACVPAIESVSTITSPNPTSETRPTFIPSKFPSLVWLPLFHSSEFHENKVLTVRDGQGAFEPSPIEIGLFWDYSAVSGRIAFASHFWEAGSDGKTSVSDLWVYDYDTGKSEMWWGDHVVRAAFSPVIDPNISKPYLAVVLEDDSLALFTGPNEFKTLSSDFSGYFSWSPDGRQLAYMKDSGLFILSIHDGQTKQLTKALNNNIDGMGWSGDKPIWAAEDQAIIYTKSPFEIARLDDSEAFTPRTADGELPEGERANTMLWSPEKRILVVEIEEMDLSRVWIYELSPDLKTIITSDSFETEVASPVAAWWEPGESILLRNGQVWSIAQKEILLTIQ
jgi:Tol biopolymer transport system component